MPFVALLLGRISLMCQAWRMQCRCQDFGRPFASIMGCELQAVPKNFGRFGVHCPEDLREQGKGR